MKSGKYAILAEYRGVALMERAGRKRAVWRSGEYVTDGFIYIFVRNLENKLVMDCFSSEHEAKNTLDSLLDWSPMLAETYLGYAEAYKVIYRTSCSRIPTYQWLDSIGHFVKSGNVNTPRPGFRSISAEDGTSAE